MEAVALRLRSLPRCRLPDREVPVATGLRARLLGLAWLDREAAGPGLLIPRCASVHTFGMRFPLDLVFLDADGWPLASRPAVPPCRFASHHGAAAVLELPSDGGEFASRLTLVPACCPSARRSPASSSARTTR